MTRRAWTARRFAERERAGARCERCRVELGYSRFCVVTARRAVTRAGVGTYDVSFPRRGELIVLCRPCCSSVTTRARRNRNQLPLEKAS